MVNQVSEIVMMSMLFEVMKSCRTVGLLMSEVMEATERVLRCENEREDGVLWTG
jgi:hypothetical protein